MNSIVCIISYLILIQMVTVCAKNIFNYVDYLSHYEHREAKLGYPFYFGYKKGQKLNMMINFKNIAPTVDIYLALSHDIHIFDVKNSKPNERAFLCNGTLKNENIWVHVELHINSVLCVRKIITEAIDLSVPNAWVASRDTYKSNDTCLQPSRPCIVEVDLNNECVGKPLPVKISCYRELKLYVCILDANLTGVIHKWYHNYGDKKSVIGYIPSLEAKTTKLLITLEKFDDNTEIYSTLTTNGMILKADRRKIQLFANESGPYPNVTILKYGLTGDTLFDCRLYLNVTKYIQIGFINTANTISTYGEKWVKMKFNTSDNGTILCCILHKVFNGDEEKHVERFIENRTILLYDESLNIVPSQKNKAMSKDSILYIIISISAVGIVILIVVIIIYIKTCRRKNNKPEESLELETYASANRVLYADLSLVGGEAQSSVHKEESTYAEIIGVLKPSSKNI